MLSKERLYQLSVLEKTLGYEFSDSYLLNKALTHKSYTNERDGDMKNNERFEFLGDAVLDLIVSDYCILTFLDYTEGSLSKIRASVVKESCLAVVASGLNLGEFLLLGKGEEFSGGRTKSSLLANAFEAVSGAIYRDGGVSSANKILLPLLKEEINIVAKTSEYRDYKSELQELTQNKFSCIPNYKVINETGPDHQKTYEVAVLVKKKLFGSGKGKNKKQAEQAAAQEALLVIQSSNQPK
jgi:ribonuclease III